MQGSEGLSGVTCSLWYVFNKGTAHTLDPLCLQPSFLFCLLCFWAHMLTHRNTHTNHKHVDELPAGLNLFEKHFQREQAPPSWLKSEKQNKTKNNENNQNKTTGNWNIANDALVEDKGYLNLIEVTLYQISVHLPCTVSRGLVSMCRHSVSLSKCYFYLLSSCFPFLLVSFNQECFTFPPHGLHIQKLPSSCVGLHSQAGQ